MIDCNITTNYFNERTRMTKADKDGACRIKCVNCPLSRYNNDTNYTIYCTELERYHSEEAVAIVQKWSDENPQRTYLSEFLKHYPNVQLYDTGIPKGICPYHLGLMSIDDCRKDHNCIACWNQPIEDGENND